MTTVWIVYHDSGPDENILGVFDNAADAEDYQESITGDFPAGVLLTPIPVPWRRTDRVTRIDIG